MAMVGVDSGSLYRRTHSLSRMAWFWVGGRLAPFYIHQMNQVNSRNDWWQHHKHCLGIIIIIINIIIINNFLQFSWKMRKSWQYDMIATAISAQTVNWGSDNGGRSSSLTDETQTDQHSNCTRLQVAAVWQTRRDANRSALQCTRLQIIHSQQINPLITTLKP